MSLKIVFVAIVALFTARVESSLNILAIQPIGGISHWNMMSGVLRVLVDSGNNVTVYTPFLNGNRDNYTEIDISNDFARGVNIPFELLYDNFTRSYKSYSVLRGIGMSLCDKVFANVDILNAMNRPEDFDLIITEPLWSDCVSYVAVKMNMPLIYTSAFSAVSFKESIIAGGYSNPLIYGNILLSHSYPITVRLKMENVFLFLQDLFGDIVDKMSRLIFPKDYEIKSPIPPAVVLVNSHAIIEKPRPGASKVLNVGGIHLNEPKSLPPDIEEFLNNSTNGVIYFAFGATLKMSSIPPEIFNKFLGALAKVQMDVLLKYEDDFHFESANILHKKWFPQRDILIHPKVKLFISHGGMCGILEALDAAVPVVGIPIIGDQFRNIDNLVNLGMAVSVPFNLVDGNNILNNISKVINSKRFADNAKKASVIFKQSQLRNKEAIINWTERAVNYKDEPSPSSSSYGHWLFLLLLVSGIALYLMMLAGRRLQERLICKIFFIFEKRI